MPKQTIHSKFEIDPAYDEEKSLVKRIEDSRTFLEKELAIIDCIEDINFQLICIFAMIDCLAQEQAAYPQESWAARKAFCLRMVWPLKLWQVSRRWSWIRPVRSLVAILQCSRQISSCCKFAPAASNIPPIRWRRVL